MIEIAYTVQPPEQAASLLGDSKATGVAAGVPVSVDHGVRAFPFRPHQESRQDRCERVLNMEDLETSTCQMALLLVKEVFSMMLDLPVLGFF